MKNRMHLDLNVGAEVSDPEQRRPVVRRRAEQLAAAGGTVVPSCARWTSRPAGAVTRRGVQAVIEAGGTSLPWLRSRRDGPGRHLALMRLQSQL